MLGFKLVNRSQAVLSKRPLNKIKQFLLLVPLLLICSSNTLIARECKKTIKVLGKTITRVVPCKDYPNPTKKTNSPRKNTIVKIGPVGPSRLKPNEYLQMHDYINRISLPKVISASRKDLGRGALKTIAIIMADEIDLGSYTYRTSNQSTPRNLIVVANRVVVSGNVTFDLAGRTKNASTRVGRDLNDRSGGDLLIMANEVVCKNNGKINFTSNSKNPVKKPNTLKNRFRKPTAKNYVSKATTAKKSKTTAPFGYTMKMAYPLVVNDGKKGKFTVGSSFFKLADGSAVSSQEWVDACVTSSIPVTMHNSMQSVVQELEEVGLAPFGFPQNLYAGYRPTTYWARHATSKWVMRMLEDVVLDMSIATLSEKRVDAVKLLRKASLMMSQTPPTLEVDREKFQVKLDKLLTLHDKYDDVLWFEERSLDLPGTLPRNVSLFTDGASLTTRVAPTDALIRPLIFGNQKKLGQIEFDQKDANKITLSFDFVLGLDPLIDTSLLDELTKEGESYKGVFNKWKLIPKPVEDHDILESKVTLASNNRDGRLTITLEAHRLGLILAKLVSRTGIPLDFEWHYLNRTDIGGDLNGLNLSLSRHNSYPITVDESGTITNSGIDDVAIDYIQLADENFEVFNSSLVINADSNVKLPTTDSESMGITVPMMAMSYAALDPYKIRSNFQIVNGGEWVDEVTITNLLGHDVERGGQLQYVDLNIRYMTTEGELTAKAKLSPIGAMNDEIKISFLHEPLSERNIIVSGTAFYEGGSYQTLKETSFSNLTIKITNELLPTL